MDMFGRLRSGYQHVAQGEGEKRDGRLVEVVKDKVARTSWRIKCFAIAGLAALMLLMMRISSKSNIVVAPNVEPEAYFFHIVMPANKKDINLCKSLVSIGVLDYPIPTLLTWGQEFNNTALPGSGSHLAKVQEMKGFLKKMGDAGGDRSNDIVVFVNGHDTWFQLRPEVLIERFFEVNRKANNRVVRRLGQVAMDTEHVSQRIVFGAQRQCSSEADDPACYAVPGSPLARSVYGPKTDRGNDRERYLSSDFIMGDLRSMKKMVDRAFELMDAEKEKVTEQDIFSRMFGEQEFQREVIRERYLGTSARIRDRLMKFFRFEQGILDSHPTHRKMEPAAGSPFEFGIGLDYEAVLGSSTVAGKDLDWVVHNDTKSIKQLRAKAQISSHMKLDMPEDIQRSRAPYWSRNPDKSLPQELGWKDISMYTNLWTGVIPASLRHASPPDDENSLRKTHWDRMWFQPNARTLLDAHVMEPYRAVAVLKNEDSETAWWPIWGEKWLIRNHLMERDKKKEWISWKDLCEGYEDEIYRDVKGPWKPPRREY